MNWQICKKILVLIALIFSIAGISLIIISEDMFNLNYQDAQANGDLVSLQILCPSSPAGVYPAACIGPTNFFSCWSLDSGLWSHLPDNTRDYLRVQCYADQAGSKYYIAVTGIFLFVGVVISVVAAFSQKTSIAVTAIYFLAFSTAMLFILLWMYAQNGQLSSSMIAHTTDWTTNDLTVAYLLPSIIPSLRAFYCIQDCHSWPTAAVAISDDIRALEWLHVLYSGVAGAVIGLVANWIALSVVTFFFEKEVVSATPKQGQAGL